MDLFRRLGECRETRNARRHIERIRSDKKRRDDDLKESQDNLSSHTPTHILHHLIQNADDTEYDSVKSTLTFTYKKGHLRIDWNGRGLSSQDIDALCHQHSGLRSVFNIADQAWIRSRKYSFKLNRQLIPQWDSFPEPSSHRGTSMYLSLSDKDSEREMVEQLQAIDPKILMLLRNIRLLRISITQDDGTVEERDLQRQDDHSPTDGHYTTTLKSDGFSERFLVFQDTRESTEGPETQLAFPIDSDDQPSVDTQKVYTLFPIQDCGIKFCIQANFSIIPNLVDLWSDSKDTLFCNILSVFEHAVDYFLAHDQYRLTWLKYLSFGPHQQEFFKQLEDSIMQRLRAKPILRSETGDLAIPSNLFYVPSHFRGDNGAPLTLCDATASMYLSREYSPSDWPLLENLGVRLLRVGDFVDQLSDAHVFHQNHEPEATQWHIRVARAIVQQSDREVCIPRLRQLSLIPLHNGRWASAVEGNLFLPSALCHSIPEGFDAWEVDSAVTLDQDRMHLMQLLHVRPFDATAIQQIVAEKLVMPEQAMTLSEEQLIKAAVFLFVTGWSNTDAADPHVATDQDSRPRPASSVYLPSKSPYSASELLKQRNGSFFLKEAYFSAGVTDEVGWKTWLSTNFGLSEIPRLQAESAEGTVSLSIDFAFLVHNARPVDWLRLLKIHHVQDDSYLKNENIRTALQSVKVPCHGGGMLPLGDTYLPYADFLGHGTSPFLQIPLDDDWSFLELLGVSVKRDIGFCTRLLKHVSGGDPSQVRLDAIYSDIARMSDGLGDSIRHDFIQNDLIYIQVDGAQGRWVSLSGCVWEGPDSLFQTPRLEKIYPSQAPLFKDILLIQDATPETLLREIDGLVPGSENPHVFALLRDVDTLLQQSNISLPYHQFQHRKIFPVVDVNGTCSMRSMDDQSDWLIADREYYRRAFDRQVPLLALPVDAISNLPTLTSLWRLDNRVVSARLGYEIDHCDEGALEQDFSDRIREKIGLIARLVPETESVTDKIELLLRTDIYRSDEITIRWIIQTQHSTVKSNAMPGHAHAIQQNGGIRMYLHQDHLSRQSLPLEFFEELEWLLKVDPRHRHLLQLIINHPDQGYLHDTLDQKGVPRSRMAVVTLLEEGPDIFCQYQTPAGMDLDGDSSASSVASSRPQTPEDDGNFVGPSSGIDARVKHAVEDVPEPSATPIE
ncbi:hypothetical protein MW887_008341 [Aspergillus wentii]|nr:hypothetical protein MW887_008341 [Aspergillus wentii]